MALLSRGHHTLFGQCKRSTTHSPHLAVPPSAASAPSSLITSAQPVRPLRQGSLAPAVVGGDSRASLRAHSSRRSGTSLLPQQPRQQGSSNAEGSSSSSGSAVPTAIVQAGNPAVFVASVLGFCFTTIEIFSPNSTGFLLSLDSSIHQFATGLPVGFRYFWADIVMSDSLIAAGILGWIAATAAALTTKRQDVTVTMLIAWAMYLWGAGWPAPPSPEFLGPFQFGDHVCGSLKLIFERVRPAPMNPTWSFPSGHTASVTFLVGTLLFVLLPILVDGKQSKESDEPTEGLQKAFEAVQGSWPLWISAYTITATGRCLADAHWFSDCLGGMLLSTSLVSLTAMLCKPAIQQARDKEATKLKESSGK